MIFKEKTDYKLLCRKSLLWNGVCGLNPYHFSAELGSWALRTQEVSLISLVNSLSPLKQVKDGPTLAAGLAPKCSARAFFVEGFVNSETES